MLIIMAIITAFIWLMFRFLRGMAHMKRIVNRAYKLQPPPVKFRINGKAVYYN